MGNLKFKVHNTEEDLKFIPRKLFCLSYAGRTKEDRQAHAQDVSQNGENIEEPSLDFSPVSSILITQNEEIEVMGEFTAGEVEFIIFISGGKTYITVGSDHADRRLEMLQSDLAKQVCAKPIASHAWKYEDISTNWDLLELKSETYNNGKWNLSQESSVTALLHPDDIIKEIKERGLPLDDGCIYYCGTVSLEGGKFWYGSKYRVNLSMPNSDMDITHEYNILPIVKKINYFTIS